MLYTCSWTLWEGLHVLSWIRIVSSKQCRTWGKHAGVVELVWKKQITTRTSPPSTGRLFWNESKIFKIQLRVFPLSSTFVGFLGGSDGKESACNVGDLDLIPGLRRSPGGGHGNPLQYSCLENPMDRGAWRAAVHGVIFKNNFIYLFMTVLGVCCCTGFFSSCGEWGLLSSCHEWASHCGGFSCCRTKALGAPTLVTVAHGLCSCCSWALEHRPSSWGTWP